PLVLEQQGDHGRAWLECVFEPVEGLSRDAGPVWGQRPLGSPASLPGLEPELEQRRDDAARTVTVQVDRHELPGLRVTGDEERIDDLDRTARLDPLQRTHTPALEAG